MKRKLLRLALAIASLLIAFIVIVAVTERWANTVAPRSDSRSMEGMILLGWPDFWRFVPDTHTVAVSPSAEFAVAYDINALGMRDKARTKKKLGSRHRIVFMGDSFTEGYGVEQESAYPRVVEELSGDRIECLNMGLRAMSPSFAYFRLKRLFEKGFEFDSVVL